MLNKLNGKEYIELNDLLQIIEDEFDVSLQIHGDKLDASALSRDQDIINQIRSSRKDRYYGRTYTGDKGLQFLREKAGEYESGSDI